MAKSFSSGKGIAIFFHADPDGIVSAVNIILSLKSDNGRSFRMPSLFPIRSNAEIPGTFWKARGKFSRAYVLDLSSVTEKEIVGLSEKTTIIDHHEQEPIIAPGVIHLNPRFKKLPPYPVSYQTYVLFGGRDWQAFVGVVDDWGVPILNSFANRMWKPYGWRGTQETLYLYSDAGRIGFAIEAGVKVYGDKKGSIIALKALMKSITPHDFLEGKSPESRLLLKASEKIFSEVSGTLGKARAKYSGKRFEIYEINSKYNIRREVIQRLKIERPGKYVLVYSKANSPGKIDFSMRGPGKIPSLIAPYGGGHPEAGGGTLPKKSLESFLEYLKTKIEP